LDSQW